MAAPSDGTRSFTSKPKILDVFARKSALSASFSFNSKTSIVPLYKAVLILICLQNLTKQLKLNEIMNFVLFVKQVLLEL